MAAVQLDPARQLIGAQCSGTLLLAKLGLLGKVPACTGLTTKPRVQEAGVTVLNQPFFASGNVATAGGRVHSGCTYARVFTPRRGNVSASPVIRSVAATPSFTKGPQA